MVASSVPEGPEERRERRTALALIGILVWCFDVLVIFFLPAGLRIGYRAVYLAIVIVLAVLGLVLVISGSRGRAAA